MQEAELRADRAVAVRAADRLRRLDLEAHRAAVAGAAVDHGVVYILFDGGIKPPLFALFSRRRFFLFLIAEAHVRVFQLEEKPLSVQAAAEAAEIAVFPHDAVAGNDDGRGISAGARPGGADRQRRARAFG